MYLANNMVFNLMNVFVHRYLLLSRYFEYLPVSPFITRDNTYSLIKLKRKKMKYKQLSLCVLN